MSGSNNLIAKASLKPGQMKASGRLAYNAMERDQLNKVALAPTVKEMVGVALKWDKDCLLCILSARHLIRVFTPLLFNSSSLIIDL